MGITGDQWGSAAFGRALNGDWTVSGRGLNGVCTGAGPYCVQGWQTAPVPADRWPCLTPGFRPVAGLAHDGADRRKAAHTWRIPGLSTPGVLWRQKASLRSCLCPQTQESGRPLVAERCAATHGLAAAGQALCPCPGAVILAAAYGPRRDACAQNLLPVACPLHHGSPPLSLT